MCICSGIGERKRVPRRVDGGRSPRGKRCVLHVLLYSLSSHNSKKKNARVMRRAWDRALIQPAMQVALYSTRVDAEQLLYVCV